MGTYETSILPHFDCCSFLLPDRPATKSTSAELDDAEAALDVQLLLSEALDAADVRSIEEPVDWGEIPLPIGVGR
jgi:adenylyl- and sulfurtransferase ThiI